MRLDELAAASSCMRDALDYVLFDCKDDDTYTRWHLLEDMCSTQVAMQNELFRRGAEGQVEHEAAVRTLRKFWKKAGDKAKERLDQQPAPFEENS